MLLWEKMSEDADTEITRVQNRTPLAGCTYLADQSQLASGFVIFGLGLGASHAFATRIEAYWVATCSIAVGHISILQIHIDSSSPSWRAG